VAETEIKSVHRSMWGTLKVPLIVASVSAAVLFGSFVGFRKYNSRNVDKRGVEVQSARSVLRLIRDLGPYGAGKTLLPIRDFDFFTSEQAPLYLLIRRDLTILGTPGTEDAPRADSSFSDQKDPKGQKDIGDKLPIIIDKFPEIALQPLKGTYDRNGIEETYLLIKLEYSEELYLFFPRASRMLEDREKRFWAMAWLGMGGAAILSSLAVLIVLLYLRRQARQAYRVMQELAEGKIKSRFQLNRFDEVGQLMTHFNRMADQLEALMIRTKEMERSRSRWLQELAHDLRTPLATVDVGSSLLHENWEKLEEIKKREVVRGNAAEIQYIKNLVEDLLFLSLLEDPDYFSQKSRFEFVALLREEMENFREKARRRGLEFLVRLPGVLQDTGGGVWMNENPQLVKRLIRNVLDNACSAAFQEVEVELLVDEKTISLLVKNDTQNSNPAWIANYGKKRESGESRTSLGLGSRIVCDIVNRLNGKMQIDQSAIPDRSAEGVYLVTFSLEFPV